MPSAVHLLVIDPQNDFCDLPPAYCPLEPLSGRPLAPALPVPGAHADMQRLATLIRQGGAGLAQITLTLDSHHQLDIAHPGFWEQGDGQEVSPFTPITAAQVRAGAFRPRRPDALPRTLAYLDALEARGRYTLMVWPVHCEIGSWGHGVHADLRAAYNEWERARQRGVAKVTKGENTWTEHYSALLAEVPEASDPHTQLNTALLAEIARADTVLVGGEASSHCVKATVEDLVARWPHAMDRIVLLTDCMSPVSGFQAQHQGFLADMHGRGLRLATAAQALSQLQAATA